MKLHDGKQKIFITGAAGFVGANLCRYFWERGHEIVASEGLNSSGWRLDALETHADGLFSRIRLDLSDAAFVHKTLLELRPTVIINTAAYGAYSHQVDADKIYRVNFDAVRTLLTAGQALDNLLAFVQTGSSSEYGFRCNRPSEDSTTAPDSQYAVSKVAASGLIQLYGQKYNLPAWSLRLYSVYGPYEDSSRLIPKLLRAAADGKFPELVHPDISRDFIHIDDVSRFIDALLGQANTLKRGEIFNVCTGHQTTLGDLVAETKTLFAIREEPRWGSMENRHWDHANWCGNPAKAKEMLGWQSSTSLRDGLLATSEWMRLHKEALVQSDSHSVVRKPQSSTAYVPKLMQSADAIRRTFLDMHFRAKAGHIGSGLSAIDILTYLYGAYLKDNDRFILSKGHSASALYATLFHFGKLSQAELDTYYQDNSLLPAHPAAKGFSAIFAATGSLGHGLPVAVGSAIHHQLSRTDIASDRQVACLLSDGECNEGTVWEAASFASHRRLSNLTVVVDANGLQGFGRTDEVNDMEPFAEKWRAFGFDVHEINGHDFMALDEAFTKPRIDKPRCIVARTVKGKGVSFMEGKMEWHYLPMTTEQFRQAYDEVGRV